MTCVHVSGSGTQACYYIWPEGNGTIILGTVFLLIVSVSIWVLALTNSFHCLTLSVSSPAHHLKLGLLLSVQMKEDWNCESSMVHWRRNHHFIWFYLVPGLIFLGFWSTKEYVWKLRGEKIFSCIPNSSLGSDFSFFLHYLEIELYSLHFQFL